MNETLTRPTEPLRVEHRELLPRIEELRAIADRVGDEDPGQTCASLRDAHAFLTGHLLRHAGAEEAALYPAVETAMQAPGATATMTRDHVGISALVDELGAVIEAHGCREGAGAIVRDVPVVPATAFASRPVLDRETARSIRRLLYELHGIVLLHFAKEEELYLETLDERLTPAAARELFERLERAAA